MRPLSPRARATEPAPAERMRSILTAAHSMTVVTDGRHHEVFRADGASPLGHIHFHDPSEGFASHQDARRVPIRLEFTDIAPTPVRDRLRARVTLSGLVATGYSADTADSTCVEFGQAVIGDATDRTYVTLEELQDAAVDPMAGCEGEMLNHLLDDHPELVTLLLRLVEPRAKHALVRAMPLSLDRYGLTLRLERADAHRDVRLPFPTPVTDLDQAGPQIHALLTAARRSSHHRLPA
ncbi:MULTISPECIES: DUF2470 domain-containing protein [unclassified Streptomyces]|uniref:DUF2470 domain-containing protein n=1 Tax=unclassified Streptomyces TaxID=2593676 RepID=UPI00382E5680